MIFLQILVRASIIFDSYRIHDIQFLDAVMISTTWDSNGHHVIREKMNHWILVFLNTDVSRQKHWRHSRRVETNDLQLSRRVHVTTIYSQSLHEDIRFSYCWISIIFPLYHKNVSFCTLFIPSGEKHARYDVWSNNYTWESQRVIVTRLRHERRSADLSRMFSCRTEMRPRKLNKNRNDKENVTREQRSMTHSIPFWRSFYFDPQLITWTSMSNRRTSIVSRMLRITRNTHRELEISGSIRTVGKSFRRSKKNRKIMFDVFIHVKKVWRWSVTFWCRVNRRHKSTEERLIDTITFKNRNSHWSSQSIHTRKKKSNVFMTEQWRKNVYTKRIKSVQGSKH